MDCGLINNDVSSLVHQDQCGCKWSFLVHQLRLRKFSLLSGDSNSDPAHHFPLFQLRSFRKTILFVGEVAGWDEHSNSSTRRICKSTWPPPRLKFSPLSHWKNSLQATGTSNAKPVFFEPRQSCSWLVIPDRPVQVTRGRNSNWFASGHATWSGKSVVERVKNHNDGHKQTKTAGSRHRRWVKKRIFFLPCNKTKLIKSKNRK